MNGYLKGTDIHLSPVVSDYINTIQDFLFQF